MYSNSKDSDASVPDDSSSTSTISSDPATSSEGEQQQLQEAMKSNKI